MLGPIGVVQGPLGAPSTQAAMTKRWSPTATLPAIFTHHGSGRGPSSAMFGMETPWIDEGALGRGATTNILFGFSIFTTEPTVLQPNLRRMTVFHTRRNCPIGKISRRSARAPRRGNPHPVNDTLLAVSRSQITVGCIAPHEIRRTRLPVPDRGDRVRAARRHQLGRRSNPGRPADRYRRIRRYRLGVLDRLRAHATAGRLAGGSLGQPQYTGTVFVPVVAAHCVGGTGQGLSDPGGALDGHGHGASGCVSLCGQGDRRLDAGHAK